MLDARYRKWRKQWKLTNIKKMQKGTLESCETNENVLANKTFSFSKRKKEKTHFHHSKYARKG